MVASVRTADAFAEELRSHGRRMTPQRRAVVDAIVELPGHPTVGDIHREAGARLPHLSQRSVYQVVSDLVEFGEVEVLDLGFGASRIERTLEHHHHVVCNECGRIDDVPADFTHVTLPSGADHGFVVDRTDVVFRGSCLECAPPDADGHQPPDTNEETHTDAST